MPSVLRHASVLCTGVVSRHAGYCYPNYSQIATAHRNSRFQKEKKRTKLCAVNWTPVARIRHFLSSSSYPYIAKHSQLHLTNETMGNISTAFSRLGLMSVN